MPPCHAPPTDACASRPSPRRKAIAGAVAGLLALLPLACSDRGDDPGDDDSTGSSDSADDTSPTTGEVDYPETLVGTFQVQLVAPVPASDTSPATAGKTSVVGKVYDAATPAAIVWESGTRSGDCQIFTPRVPFCDTPCGGSAVCVEDNTCEPYPTAGSVGTVTARGLKTSDDASEFTMEPIANNYQPPATVTLAYPAFAEGDLISLEAPGADLEGFKVSARGIAPLVLANDAIPLADDTPVALTWTPAADPDRSRVHVKLDISHHGGTKGMIECDTADAGALEIAGPLITELLDLGVAGFPSIILTRRAVGSAAIAAGRIDLVVSSKVEHFVDIAGLTSCSADSDCPDGQTCQADLTCK